MPAEYGLTGAVGALGSSGFAAAMPGMGPYRGAGTPPLPMDPAALSGGVSLAGLGLGGMLGEPLHGEWEGGRGGEGAGRGRAGRRMRCRAAGALCLECRGADAALLGHEAARERERAE